MSLRRFLAERELIIVFGVFGIAQMMADTMADFELGISAALVRIVGLCLIVLMLWIRAKKHLQVPVLMVESQGTDHSRSMLDEFLKKTKLEKSAKLIDNLCPLKKQDLVLSVPINLRNSKSSNSWEKELNKLISDFAENIEEQSRKLSLDSERIYHIRPNIVLPLSFAVGAFVGLRRSVVLYHKSVNGAIHKKLDLTNPRCLHEQTEDLEGLKMLPEGVSPPEQRGDKLILHLVISDRHEPKFEFHEKQDSAMNVAIVYPYALPGSEHWTRYAQAFVQKAKPWTEKFNEVDLCLVCPDVIAFAWGMAFFRNPHIRICHWLDNKYIPVINLALLEKKLRIN